MGSCSPAATRTRRRSRAGPEERRHRRGERGDTLAETIVTLTIVGVVAVGMFAAFSTATQSANALTHQDRVRNELISATATIQSAPFVLSTGALPDTTTYPKSLDLLDPKTLDPAFHKGVNFVVSIDQQPTSKLQEITVTATAGADTLKQTIFKEKR